MGRTSPGKASLAKKKQSDHELRVHERRLSAARATLLVGSSSTATIATLLGLAGRWSLGDDIVRWAIAAVCVIVALTLFVVVYLMRR
jgi:hypothetical protein